MNVYSYYGHAGDICISNGDLKMAKVPKNSTYVARTGCGLVALVDQSFGNLLVDPVLRNALQRPQDATKKKTIETFIGEEIEIHEPNTEIVESMYNPLGVYEGKKGTFTIFLSGMRDEKSFKNFGVHNGKLDYSFQTFPKGSRVPKRILLQSFQGAIYPSKQTVLRTFVKDSYSQQELERIAKDLKRSVVELMREYPGIHYNLLCRSVHESCRKAALKRRIFSAYQFDTQFETLQRTLKYEDNDKNIESFLQQLPEAFYQNLDKVALLQLQKDVPPTRRKYIEYILNKRRTIVPEKKAVEPIQVVKKSKTKKNDPKSCSPGYVYNSTRKNCRKQRNPGFLTKVFQFLMGEAR